MTFQDWQQKYYPTPADSEMAMVEAVEHSLRKWRGLTKEVLGEYGLRITDRQYLRSGKTNDYFVVSGATCALCHKYGGRGDCSDCPLAEVLGHGCGDNAIDPWSVFLSTGNPLPMIAALEKALEFAKGVKP